ncbi:endonuclease [Vibrio inusitatus NBRC 102082]|uniref:Endonuclease n=1 Tax=Vibrio inusitatus NBRC 102082 TaxID=1219070 RepID=A0A4Y3HTD0_9VIBR|nr:endonuclease/exonuclease/phosphatase family protein [Vibrio inusitatus]GEA50231.1 endonuclease [Vibrio inusitatus NBRC 102082]
MSEAWWAENLTAIPVLMFVVYIALSLLSGFLKDRFLFAINISIGLLFFSFTPNSTAKVEETCGDSVTVVQYNLAFENTNLKQFIDYLESTEPDLVVMQEVSPEHGQAFSYLSTLYPHRYGGQPKVGYPSNQLILSRHLLYGMSVFRTPDGQNIIRGIWQPRIGTDIGLIAAHPPSPRSKALWYRRDALIRTAEYLVTSSAVDTNIVIGDFNLSASSPSYKDIFIGYESLPVASWKGTRADIQVPALAMTAIDHFWLNTDVDSGVSLCAREALLEIQGSDHVPVKTRLNL